MWCQLLCIHERCHNPAASNLQNKKGNSWGRPLPQSATKEGVENLLRVNWVWPRLSDRIHIIIYSKLLRITTMNNMQPLRPYLTGPTGVGPPGGTPPRQKRALLGYWIGRAANRISRQQICSICTEKYAGSYPVHSWWINPLPLGKKGKEKTKKKKNRKREKNLPG